MSENLVEAVATVATQPLIESQSEDDVTGHVVLVQAAVRRSDEKIRAVCGRPCRCHVADRRIGDPIKSRVPADQLANACTTAAEISISQPRRTGGRARVINAPIQPETA